MHDMTDRGHRTRLLLVLAISMALLVALWIFAMSLDHWGDTRTVIFTVSGFALIAVGLGALGLLVTDLVRARRSEAKRPAEAGSRLPRGSRIYTEGEHHA